VRVVRFLVAALAVLAGAFLLLLANGVSMAMRERTQGWEITPLPSQPVAHIVVYASSGIALQFLAAWLLMPATVEKGTSIFWRRYSATVGLCILAALFAAFVTVFIVMALLDSGTI